MLKTYYFLVAKSNIFATFVSEMLSDFFAKMIGVTDIFYGECFCSLLPLSERQHRLGMKTKCVHPTGFVSCRVRKSKLLKTE